MTDDLSEPSGCGEFFQTAVLALVKGFHAPLQAEKLYHPEP